MHLEDSTLIRTQCYVNGAWVDGHSSKRIEVTNPSDRTVLATVPNLGKDEARNAIDAAHYALHNWRRQTAKERAGYLRRWFDLIVAHGNDLALLMSSEQGKPLAEARGEVAYGAAFVEWFAEEAKRVYGDVIPPHLPDKRIVVIKEPVGVVAAITPWNFPLAMITRKCAPALAAGCTVVIKPAEETPLTALALAELAHRAGLPAGVINVVTGKPGEIGGELTANNKVRKLSFTGSTEVGKLLMRQCADTVKKVSLELGGNAPLIVFEDADLDAAVCGAMASKYRNSGQTCVCVNRVLVHDSIYDDFVGRFAQSVSALKVGPGTTDGVEQGPLINEAAVVKVERLIADAESRGARAVTGGKRHALGGNFFEPTVLADATADMDCANEEIFGPIAPLYRFSAEEEAVQLANDTPYGLAAYFFSRDVGRVWRVAEALEYGIVGINEGIISTETAPFGGMKESGIGREGSKYGIDEYLEIKYLCMGGIHEGYPS